MTQRTKGLRTKKFQVMSTFMDESNEKRKEKRRNRKVEGLTEKYNVIEMSFRKVEKTEVELNAEVAIELLFKKWTFSREKIMEEMQSDGMCCLFKE